MRAEDLHVLVLTRAVFPMHGVGGLERHVHDLVRSLLGRGARVTLITRPATAGERLAPHERLTVQLVPYRTFPFAGRRGTTVVDRSLAYPAFGRRAGQLAADLVRDGNIHLVHGMGAACLGYADARRSDWFETVPFVFNPHGMEEFGSTGPGLATLKHLAYAPLRKAVRACAGAADRIIATDRVLVPAVLKHLGVDESRVRVVPNAVDVEALDGLSTPAAARSVRAQLGLSNEDVLLVAVGRLEENKGFHQLIAALAQLATRSSGALSTHARWRLVLLGEGSQRARLVRDVASANLSGHVLLPGRADDSTLHAWYEAATLFVHPTLYEGSSIVTLEAMAHRLAVVATAAGGIPDKVRPGVNGWLVAPGDAGALAGALEDALVDRARLKAMGKESRAIVEQEFAWTAIIERLFDLYADMLARASSARR